MLNRYTARIDQFLPFTTFVLFMVLSAHMLVPAPARGDDTTAPPVVPTISAGLQQFVDRGDLAGAVALVAQHGEFVHLGAVGYANVDSQRPMRLDTLFSIMSMTKPVAAVAALICCDEGKLALDEPLARWLPEFNSPPHNTITLRHVLTHTSGLFSDQRNTGTLAETVAGLAKQKLQFEPGSRWLYSPGLTVAGRAVEVASGMPFDEFVEERICQPLKMPDTEFRLSPDDGKRLATTYAYNSRDKVLSPARINFLGPMETRSPNPSGGLYSTATDLFRFYRMLLGHGELDGVRILKPETVDEMRRPQTGELKAGFVPGSAWGLGVGLVQQPAGITAMLSPGTFGHGGMLGTQAWADPEREAILILLIQRAGLPNSDASEYRLVFQQAAVAALDADK
ncbi:MAG: beta-lactamase family protein [Pirellulales bacterium]|nr:beta-lactamase family protein [Pirellulales bacterium]